MKNPNGFSTLLTMLSLTVGSVTSLTANAAFSLDDLRQQVKEFVVTQVDSNQDTRWEINIRGLDPRIKLTECPTAINFRATGSQAQITRNSTIHAQCLDEQGQSLWALYIPTQIKKLQKAVIAKSSLPSGHIVESDDVEIQFRDTFALRGGYFLTTEQVIGSKTRQSVTSGQVMRKRALCQVCKGEAIIIEATGGGLSVVTEGLALNNGTQGETIRVQNKRSGRKINAVVVATGKVQIKI